MYALAQEADAAFEGARERIAAFAGADAAHDDLHQERDRGDQPRRLLLGPRQRGPGRRGADHPDGAPRQHRALAGAVPRARRRSCATWRWTSAASSRSTRSTRELARGDVRLVAFAHVSNVLGTINPVAEIVARAPARPARVTLDRRRPGGAADARRRGARSAPTSTRWTGHKALGPTGIGVLHGRARAARADAAVPHRRRHDRLGGLRRRATWNELPWKFEAGTPLIAEAVGLGAAVDYLAALGMERVREHEQALTAHMLERPRARCPACAWSARPTPSAAAGWRRSRSRASTPTTSPSCVDREGVCIRAGHHCAQPLMRCLGVGATARASVGVYNEPRRRGRAVEALHRRRARCSGSRGVRRWTTSTATTSSTTTSARATSASSSRTTSRRSSTTRCAATSWACTSASRTTASRTCASTATAARSRRRRRRSPRRSSRGWRSQEVGELGADWMIELLGIPVSATRRKCALLNLKVVRGAVTGDDAWPA